MKLAHKITNPLSPRYGAFQGSLEHGSLFIGKTAAQVDADILSEADQALADLAAIRAFAPRMLTYGGYCTLLTCYGDRSYSWSGPTAIGEPLSRSSCITDTPSKALDGAMEHLRQMDPTYVPGSYSAVDTLAIT